MMGFIVMLSTGMLLHSFTRFISTVIGIAFAFFLAAAQVGLLVGWCNTTSAIIRNAAADVWVMAEQTPAFDYGTGIPRERIYQVRSVPGVDWAEGMFMGWNYWQRPDGRRMNVEVVGLDESCIGGPWEMYQGIVEQAQDPDTVIIDELYMASLGVVKSGDEVEILGRRARIGGISQGVRTFTAAPFVFTALDSAIKYDGRSDSSEITYVLARCESGMEPAAVCQQIQSDVPAVEALTTRQFAVRTMKYWMLETGVGITVVLTAVLGLAVGTVITSQTLYAITNDHRSEYATLLATGVSHFRLSLIVMTQAALLGGLGIAVGAALFWYATVASARTPIPVETTPIVFAALCVFSMGSCLAASLLSIRTLRSIDPVTVFHR